jgi:hypothetical protein
MASSRPRTAGSEQSGIAAWRGRRVLALLAALLMLALTLAAPGVAVAAGTSTEGTSGYKQKPEEPKTGTSPSKEEKSTPASKEEPAASATPSPAKSGTLPFTGFDLRWTVAVGVVLMAAGFSIVIVQRRGRSRVGAGGERR